MPEMKSCVIWLKVIINIKKKVTNNSNHDKMKKLISFAIFFAFSAAIYAQAEATASATATIVGPITITNVDDMNFGNVAVNATTGGTVELAPDGTRTPTGGCTLPATTGTVSAASFTVTGAADYTYSITLPSGATTITSGGGQTMTVDTWTSATNPIGAILTGGTSTLTVGATLNVAAGQAAGTYTSGTEFTVSVNYN